MTIIIGLGNPGAQYVKTRHNIGFMAIDKFSEKNNFPAFKLEKKLEALVSSINNIILAKPQTFMNESGKAVKKIIKNLPVENLIIIHDDIDLPVGKIKIIKERGSAGHKGVESIIQNIGNNGLIRIRIGIAPLAQQSHKPDQKTKAKNVVLKKFTEEEQEIINQTIEKTAEALDFLLENKLQKAMNEYNK